MDNQETNRIIAQFASDNGINVHEGEPENSRYFIDDCWIHYGEVFYKPAKCDPCNLIHEIGHLALLPAELREYINGDVEECLGFCYGANIMLKLGYEDPYSEKYSKLVNASEDAVLAWEYCVAIHLNLEPLMLFQDFTLPPEDLLRTYEIAAHTGLGCRGTSQLRHLGLLESDKTFPKLIKFFND
jgi:hypothetical protein